MNRNNFFIHLALALVLVLVAAFAGQLSRLAETVEEPGADRAVLRKEADRQGRCARVKLAVAVKFS